MGRGLHINDVLPEELRVHVPLKEYPRSKTSRWKGELAQMSREYLPEGYVPIDEIQVSSIEDIKSINEAITSIRVNKFRDTKANMLLSALRCGMPVNKACQIAGITVETYRNWYERGKDGEEPYRQFFDSLEAIQFEMEQWCLSAIKDAADRSKVERTITTVETDTGTKTTVTEKPAKFDWRAAAYLLEHLDPESYGKNREPQNVTTNNTQIVVQLPSNNRAIEMDVTPQPKKAGRPKSRKF